MIYSSIVIVVLHLQFLFDAIFSLSLFVVCGCSILVSRYVGVSHWSTEIGVSYSVARHYYLR